MIEVSGTINCESRPPTCGIQECIYEERTYVLIMEYESRIKDIVNKVILILASAGDSTAVVATDQSRISDWSADLEK